MYFESYSAALLHLERHRTTYLRSQQTRIHPTRLCLLTYAKVMSNPAPIVVTGILHFCGRLRRLLHPKTTCFSPLCGRAQGGSLFYRLSAQYCRAWSLRMFKCSRNHTLSGCIVTIFLVQELHLCSNSETRGRLNTYLLRYSLPTNKA